MRSPGPENSNLLPKDGRLFYFPHLFSIAESEVHLSVLTETLEWSQPAIKLYGKLITVPRLTAWYGDPGTDYSYSGIRNEPKPWTSALIEIKKKVEAFTGSDFNSVLLNLYRNGSDHMSWHADDEKSLGSDPVIASVSFGAIRKFGLKHRYEKDLKPLSLNLGSGSLVLMEGETQRYWHHRIHPTKRDLGPRMNLTFRRIISS